MYCEGVEEDTGDSGYPYLASSAENRARAAEQVRNSISVQGYCSFYKAK